MIHKVNRWFILLAGSVFIMPGAPPAASPVRLRPACFDVAKLPKVVSPLDVKRSHAGFPVLSPETFHLLEDGVTTAAANRIMKFRDTNMGLALIVALDASGSMNGRPLKAIQEGLAQLVSRKRSEDRIAILSFADETRWETRWDSSSQATKDAFQNLKARGNWTRLYDALEDANQEFDRQAEKEEGFPIRRCIIVLSDGHDEGSHIGLARLLEDIGKSRVRVDAVGMARSPLWFGNMRQIAKAGFGEFQTAALPEDLTDLLGGGIDSLLDMPALEFRAKHLETDGKIHQIGLEQGSGVRDQISLKLPEPLWRTRRFLYAIAGGLAILLVSIFLVWRFRQQKPAAPPALLTPVVESKPVPSSLPSLPPLRAATVAEPASRVMLAAQAAAPVISYDIAVPVTNMAAKPARVATALSSCDPAFAANLRLEALSGPYAGQNFSLNKEEFWIGSAANNSLCLGADAGVSGHHVCIRREQHVYRAYDNGSLNNTFVNGHAIGRQISLLQPGDRIRVGSSEFAVSVGD